MRVDGQLTYNSSLAMLDAVRCGFGIAYLPEHMVKSSITRGEVVVVLDDWSPTFSGYHLYYPTRRQNSAAFRMVIDALRDSSE